MSYPGIAFDQQFGAMDLKFDDGPVAVVRGQYVLLQQLDS